MLSWISLTFPHGHIMETSYLSSYDLSSTSTFGSLSYSTGQGRRTTEN